MASPTPGALAGRVALVTGSTDGIGLASARALAEQGCTIVLNGLGEPAAIGPESPTAAIPMPGQLG